MKINHKQQLGYGMFFQRTFTSERNSCMNAWRQNIVITIHVEKVERRAVQFIIHGNLVFGGKSSSA